MYSRARVNAFEAKLRMESLKGFLRQQLRTDGWTVDGLNWWWQVAAAHSFWGAILEQATTVDHPESIFTTDNVRVQKKSGKSLYDHLLNVVKTLHL